MTKLVGCLVLLITLAGCTDGSPAPDAVESPVGHELEGSCANEPDVVDDESARTESGLTGDIDGDGDDDEVFVVNDDSAEAGCKSFLVIVVADDVYSAPIDPTGSPRTLPVPSLNSLANVGRDPGAEIVVNIETGASTQFVGLFTLTDEGLERMTIDGRGPGPFPTGEDLFAFGGSVGHMEAVTCIASNIVIVSAAVPSGSTAERYEVERRFFLVEGTTLRLDEGSIERHTVPGSQIDRFPEFERSPFVGCD
jgi:hypothetical protein